MRRVAALLATLALLALPATALAQEEFTAELDADQEVPAPTVPDDYAGSGSGTATISDDGTEITFEVTFDGLTGPATMSHIHYGPPGQAGGILFWLSEMGSEAVSPLSGTLTEADFTAVDGGPQTFDEALEAIRAGNTYFNVHTDANQPGEIRGQLMASEDPGEDPELPDTSTSAAGDRTTPVGPSPALLLMLAIGAGAFVFGVRRFAFRRV